MFDLNIINLEEYKEENTAHISGLVKCLACNQEWAAVAPIGTIWLICPTCSIESATWKQTILNDVSYWHCLCGNWAFYITENGVFCPRCGQWQKGF